jgi:hypothetical protein
LRSASDLLEQPEMPLTDTQLGPKVAMSDFAVCVSDALERTKERN